MSMLARAVTALVFGCALATPASAATWYVDPDGGPVRDGLTWCTAFLRLEHALAVAAAGDVIRMAEGEYVPDWSGLLNPRTATFSLKDGVTIEGHYAGCGAPNPDFRDPANHITNLSGDVFQDDDLTNNCYHVITAKSVGAGTVLDGLYVDDGYADGVGVTDGTIGAGLLCVSSRLLVRDVIFQGLIAIDQLDGSVGRGGSVFSRKSTPVFMNCLFRESIAGQAGGGVYNESSKATFLDCFFAGCITNAKGGGGLFNDAESGAYLRDTEFLLCIASNAGAHGGGAYEEGSQSLYVNCSFSLATATNGGGVYFYKAGSDLVNCTFGGFTGADENGAAIHAIGSTVSVTNGLITGCTAGGRGAIYATGSKLKVFDCTLADNDSGAGAAGIHVAGNGGAEIVNTILWGNQAAGTGGEAAQLARDLPATVALDFCDVEGLTGGFGGVGNIGLDPLFAGGGDYRLTGGSPCIDAGNLLLLPVDVGDLDLDTVVAERLPLDLDLTARVKSGQVDMGAYEHGKQ